MVRFSMGASFLEGSDYYFKRLWKRLKTLLKKCNKCTIEVRRLRTFALGTYKTSNDLNPAFMKIFLQKGKYQTDGKTT